MTTVPTPRRSGAYGDVERPRPLTGDHWTGERGYPLLIRTGPQRPGLPRWAARLQTMSSWRYALGAYGHPAELRLAQKLVRLRQPRLESL